eukprot:1182397-Prorocentrum_minimum.AAC.3
MLGRIATQTDGADAVKRVLAGEAQPEGDGYAHQISNLRKVQYHANRRSVAVILLLSHTCRLASGRSDQSFQSEQQAIRIRKLTLTLCVICRAPPPPPAPKPKAPEPEVEIQPPSSIGMSQPTEDEPPAPEKKGRGSRSSAAEEEKPKEEKPKEEKQPKGRSRRSESEKPKPEPEPDISSRIRDPMSVTTKHRYANDMLTKPVAPTSRSVPKPPSAIYHLGFILPWNTVRVFGAAGDEAQHWP